MTIFPLPRFEEDADPVRREPTDAEVYAALEAPKTIVVRYGAMRYVGEFRHESDAKPGCGTKLVIRTPRGTEIAEMLTTTCENAGCGKSVTRQEMLEYIERSGGKDYPFHTNGMIIRVATVEDLNQQSALDREKPNYVRTCRRLIAELDLDMKLVDVEPILGGEQLTFFYMAEKRVDFRELVKRLAADFSTRIEMQQVGARDEARLVADYERCGQHCCCKTFLKVLKPVSMRSAKLQKATLDPLKISGRCGRLMCCLRYEDQTYRELKSNLPHRQTRVGTAEGAGVVIDSKVLVQLVLVRLEHDGREIAVPVEELMDPETCPKPGELAAAADPLRGLSPGEAKRRGRRGRGEKRAGAETAPDAGDGDGEKKGKRRRRRRRRGGGDGGDGGGGDGAGLTDAQAKFREREQSEGEGGGGGGEGGGAPQGQRKKRRRRRGRGKRGGGGGGGGGGDGGD